MATAANLQQDAAGQKLNGPFDPSDGSGKAQRGANIDQTEGYADGQVALMDHANANLDKADDAAITLGTVRGIPIILLADDTASDSVDEGDGGVPRMTLARIIRVALSDDNGLSIHKADDAAFTPGTSVVVPIGALADETGPDSVDEGDTGALRMTLARILRVALSDDSGLSLVKADDAAFTPGTSIVTPIGAMADDASTDSVDEGDVGIPRMSLDRILLAGGATKTIDLSGTSPASATTEAGTPVTGLGPYRSMAVYANVQGGTGGTLDIYIQFSPDGGTTWVDYAHFAQLTDGAAAIKRVFTVSKSAQQTTLQAVGSGTSPALAASTIIGGSWGDRLRVVMVAGAGTSAGTAQSILAVLTS